MAGSDNVRGPGDVSDVRNRIIELAREIDRLASSDLSEKAFFSEFLKRVVAATGAKAGAVWMLEADRRLGLTCDVQLADTGFIDNPEALPINQRLLGEVLHTGQTTVFSPDDPSGGRLPTRNLIILAPIQRETECVGIVEIFQRPDVPQQARAGYMQFIEQMCGYASRYLREREVSREVVDDGDFETEIREFLLQLQGSLDITDVSATAANEVRRLLGCDRATIAVLHGRTQAVVTAISGQDSVNRRANLVRTMENMIGPALASGDVLEYTGELKSFAPQVEVPLVEYIQESGSRMVLVFPLFRPKPQAAEEGGDDQTRQADPTPVGALVLEQVGESRPRPGVQNRAGDLVPYVAAAVANARSMERIFLLSLWQRIGRMASWFEGRRLLKTLTILAFLLGGALSMVYVPWEYRVEGQGRLMPVVQTQLFAPRDAKVDAILVHSGERVKAGQTLLKLSDPQLATEIVMLKSSLAEKSQLRKRLRIAIDEASDMSAESDELRLHGQYVQNDLEIAGLKERLAKLKDEDKKLTVKAPHAGIVTTFQIVEMFGDRPVMRGMPLLEIMDDNGQWRLELQVEEHRMGHLLHGQEEYDRFDIPIEYVLATATEKTFNGRLDTISTRSVPSAELGSIVECFGTLTSERLPDRRIGAEVRAKIHCGKRSLGYVLFGDVIEFFQMFFWL